jgi:hypothetical protein
MAPRIVCTRSFAAAALAALCLALAATRADAFFGPHFCALRRTSAMLGVLCLCPRARADVSAAWRVRSETRAARSCCARRRARCCRARRRRNENRIAPARGHSFIRGEQ